MCTEHGIETYDHATRETDFQREEQGSSHNTHLFTVIICLAYLEQESTNIPPPKDREKSDIKQKGDKLLLHE